jgi:hypothetical protein
MGKKAAGCEDPPQLLKDLLVTSVGVAEGSRELKSDVANVKDG